MTITLQLFEAFLKCPTKCFLRALGETGVGNAWPDWASAQNSFYRHDGIRRLKEAVASADCITGPLDGRGLKSGTWRLATDGKVSAQNLESTLHALERVPSNTPGQPTQFIPTRFVFTNKLGQHDKLLLAFDAVVLSETLGRELDVGHIIHGDDRIVQSENRSATQRSPENHHQDCHFAFQPIAAGPRSESELCRVRVPQSGANKRPLRKTISACWLV